MTVVQTEKQNGDTKKLEPPEGGWGYAVAIALIIVFITGFGHLHSMGLLLGDFFIRTGYGLKGYTILMGVFNIFFSISGIVTSIAMKRFTLRVIGFAASAMILLGWILTIFATDLWEMIISLGVVQVLGAGVAMTVCLTSFNQYFNKRRMAVIGVCKMFVGIGNAIYPLFLNYTLVNYGYVGTVIILTAIVTHVFLGILLMQPVEWHQKKVKSDEDVTKKAAQENEEEGKFIEKIHQNENFSSSNIKQLFVESREDDSDMQIQETRSRAGTMSMVSTDAGIPGDFGIKPEKKASIWKMIGDMLDINLFKDPIFCNICFGMSMAMVSDMVFFSIIPLQLAADNFPQHQVAYCLSAVSAADLVARGFIGLLGNYFHFSSRSLCTVGVIGSFLFRIVYLNVEGFIPVMISVAILGFLRSPISVSFTIIYAEYIPEKFTAAFGMQSLVFGILGSTLTPAFGIIRDWTKSYFITFHILNSLYLLILIPWSIEFYITRKKSSNKKTVK